MKNHDLCNAIAEKSHPFQTLSRRRAITLIELLVLLTTLAVLLAVVVPAMSKQQGDSQRTHELDNLRVLSQLMAKYSADDPQGILGPVHPADHLFSGGIGYAEYGGGPGTMPYGGWGTIHDPPQSSDSGLFDPRTRPLNFYLYGRDTISTTTAPGDPNVFKPFQCLGEDRGWQGLPGFGSDSRETEPNSYYKGNGTSFRMSNLAYSGGPPVAPNFSTAIYGRTASRVPLPSQTLTFFEVRVYETLWTNSTTGVLDPIQLTGNHKKPGFFHTTYADGHAAFADFGVNSYYTSLLTIGPFAGTDARGTWGRMDCWPDLPIVFGGSNFSTYQPGALQSQPQLAPPTLVRSATALPLKGDVLP